MITLSDKFDVHSGYGANGGPLGARNIVSRNCIWSPGAVTAAGTGFTMRANRKVNPRVVRVNKRYRLADSSPCTFARATASPSSVSGILFGS